MLLRNSQTLKLQNFTFEEGFTRYIVSSREIAKPYFISRVVYGTDVYEDMILWLNNIDDPFQLLPGVELIIPDLEELKDFVLDNKVPETNIETLDP